VIAEQQKIGADPFISVNATPTFRAAQINLHASTQSRKALLG
jgi:hypothetical protein